MQELERLFDLRGIAPSFWNYKGEHVQLPEENRSLILDAMGIKPCSDDEAAREVEKLELAHWEKVLPPLASKEFCFAFDLFLRSSNTTVFERSRITPKFEKNRTSKL